MKKYALACYIIVLLVAIPSFGQVALPTMLVLSPDKKALLISGAIDEIPGPKTMVQLVKEMPNTVEVVQLESLGGRLDIALEIAQEIKRRGINTYASIECHSACTFIFMAGKKRITYLTSYFVFHRIKFYQDGVLTKGFDQGYWQGRASQYYLDQGAYPEVVALIENNDSISVHGSDLLALGIANDVRDNTKEDQFLNLVFKDGEILNPIGAEGE